MINYKTRSGGCWCLSQNYFKTENIDCFELEVTAAKDVGRFKLLSKTENLKKTLLFFPVCILRSSFIRVLKVNTFPFLNFYEKRSIFRMMKNKNRIRQLTEKHSNKEVLLAGAIASHQRGLFEYHSPVKNIIEFNSRETIENKLSQKWKNPSFSRFRGKKCNCFYKTRLTWVMKRNKKIEDSLISFIEYWHWAISLVWIFEKGLISRDHYGMVGMKNSLSERGIRDFESDRDCLQTW